MLTHRLAFASSLAVLAVIATPALAQTKWDLPAAYGPSNCHTESLVQFAGDVDKATAGKL